MNLHELKFDEKTKKAIVVGFPFNLPDSELTKHCQISSATRMRNKEGALTKTMLCTFTGRIPDKVDLGHWGKFSTKTYYPEPLRCFNCQRYGHHKSACTSPAICAVCSGRHATENCIAKHKEGNQTKLRCPNCKNQHPAWHRRCPTRIGKIQAALPRRDNTPAKSRQVPAPATVPVTAPVPVPAPAPRTKYYTKEQLERARSLSRSRGPEVAPPKPLPRTIFIEKESAKKEIIKYTDIVLRSVGLRASTESLDMLSGMLVNGLLELSNAIPNFQPTQTHPNSSSSSASLPNPTSSSASSPKPTTSPSSEPLPKTNPSSSSKSSSTSSSASSHSSLTSSSSTTSSTKYDLPPPISTRPKTQPHPSSNTEFPPLKHSQPLQHPYSKPFPPGTTIAQAASAAQGLSTPFLKRVSFRGNLTRRPDPRLEKSRREPDIGILV